MMSLTDKQKARVGAMLDVIPYPLALRDEARQTVTLGLTAADEQLRALIKKWRGCRITQEKVPGHPVKLSYCRHHQQAADELSEYVLPEEASE